MSVCRSSAAHCLAVEFALAVLQVMFQGELTDAESWNQDKHGLRRNCEVSKPILRLYIIEEPRGNRDGGQLIASRLDLPFGVDARHRHTREDMTSCGGGSDLR